MTTNIIDQYDGLGWTLFNGDSAEVLPGIPSDSVDLSIFSPPFADLFAYSASERDLGNCRGWEEFFAHFGHITPELLRATKPGRLACVHVTQLPLRKNRDGVIGMRDFRGAVLQHFIDNGWIYHGEICIDKDPQAQAIRTKQKGLLFVQLRKDASWMRQAFADYILIFRKPGENAVPIKPDITNNDWIEWARPIWFGIRETHTLNALAARSEEDERHICPLQLDTIERCVRLWSNPGDTVLDPFNGIGSTGVVALKHGRRYVGVELKIEYARVAARNLKAAEQASVTPDLFSALEAV